MRTPLMRRFFNQQALITLALTILVLFAPEALGATTKTTAGESKSLITFFGRMHILVLHLPIGMLIGAFVVEVLGFFKRSKGYDIAAAWIFVLGAGAAVLAVTFGLMLESPDGTGSLTEQWHKWLGISVGVIAIVGAVLKVIAVNQQWKGDQKVSGGAILLVSRSALILLVVLLLPVTGHLGGNMTHGNTYLVEHSPIEVPAMVVHFPDKPPVVVQVASNSLEARWESEVQPILNEHCTSCHGPSKQKGDVRLDSLELTLAGGGEDGEIELLVLGSAFDSLIYRVSVVPPNDERRMPTGSRPGLTPEELEVLGLWLVDAQDLGSKTPSGQSATSSTGATHTPEKIEPTFNQAAADQITDAGGRAIPISLSSLQMEVSFANLSPLPDDALASLDAAADHIEKLYLQMSGITDEGLKNLPDMPALLTLDLKDTAITDAGLANLPEMFSIEKLNLFGTEITDDGLKYLEDFITLESLYLAGTAVTEEGVNTLREAMPDTEIYSDF